MPKSKYLGDYVLKPFYILEQGDLVRVKSYNKYYGGMLAVVADNDRYGIGREVVLSTGKKTKLMTLELEKIEEDE